MRPEFPQRRAGAGALLAAVATPPGRAQGRRGPSDHGAPAGEEESGSLSRFLLLSRNQAASGKKTPPRPCLARRPLGIGTPRAPGPSGHAPSGVSRGPWPWPFPPGLEDECRACWADWVASRGCPRGDGQRSRPVVPKLRASERAWEGQRGPKPSGQWPGLGRGLGYAPRPGIRDPLGKMQTDTGRQERVGGGRHV